MRKIISTSNGNSIPVTMDLNIKPLLISGKPVFNGLGEKIMNDQWIYIGNANNRYAINVNRSKYCEKMYLSKITIQESIGINKLMDEDLKTFVEKVSDKLVFEKYGKWYRVFLKKINRRKFSIDKVVPYISIYNPNAKVLNFYAHEMCIDWRKKFYIY